MELKELLISRGIKPSVQRMAVLKYLKDAKNHPSVDSIYSVIIKEIPTLSKTTIYNTLKIFVKKNIVNEIVIEGNEARYEFAYDLHAHFKCLSCQKIYDIDLEIEKLIDTTKLNNFQIDTIQFYLKGKCDKCNKM